MTGGLIIGAATSYMAILGASTSWQYYLSVDEAVADIDHLAGKRARVSGRVVAGTLAIGADRREATFLLSGVGCTLPAMCNCSLPDNFREGIEVVVEGTLLPEAIRGHKVITRCASKYEAASKRSPRSGSSSNESA